MPLAMGGNLLELYVTGVTGTVTISRVGLFATAAKAAAGLAADDLAVSGGASLLGFANATDWTVSSSPARSASARGAFTVTGTGATGTLEAGTGYTFVAGSVPGGNFVRMSMSFTGTPAFAQVVRMYARLAHGGVATQAWYGLGFGNNGAAYNSATDALYDSTGAALHGGVFQLVRSAVDLSQGAWTSAGAWPNPYALALDASPPQSPLWPSAADQPPMLAFTIAANSFLAAPYNSIPMQAGTYNVDLLGPKGAPTDFQNGAWTGASSNSSLVRAYNTTHGRPYVAPGVFGSLATHASWRSADGLSHTAAYEAWVKRTFDPAMFLNTDTNQVWKPDDGIGKMKLRYCSANYQQYDNTAYWLAFPLVNAQKKPYQFVETWKGTTVPTLNWSTAGDCTAQWYYRWGYTSKQSPKRLGLSRWGDPHFPSYYSSNSATVAMGNWSEHVSTTTVISGNPFRNEEKWRSVSIFGSCAEACGMSSGHPYSRQLTFASDPLVSPNTTFIELRGYPNGNFNAGEATLLAKVDTQIFLSNKGTALMGSADQAADRYGMYHDNNYSSESYITWHPLLASGSWSHFQLSLPYTGPSDRGSASRNDRADPDYGNFIICDVARIISTFGTPHCAILGA